MTRRTRWASRSSHGFTLLELLVAISLLGLVFVLISGGIRFGTKAWVAGSQARAMVDDRRIVQGVLLRQLGSALALPVETTRLTRAVEFEGTPARITFVGTAPALAAPPGLYRYRLELEHGDDGVSLVLSWRSSKPAREGRETLVTGLGSAVFAYYGDPRGERVRQWRDSWEDGVKLPQAVRLAVTSDRRRNRPWPPIVVDLPAGGN